MLCSSSRSSECRCHTGRQCAALPSSNSLSPPLCWRCLETRSDCRPSPERHGRISGEIMYRYRVKRSFIYDYTPLLPGSKVTIPRRPVVPSRLAGVGRVTRLMPVFRVQLMHAIFARWKPCDYCSVLHAKIASNDSHETAALHTVKYTVSQ